MTRKEFKKSLADLTKDHAAGKTFRQIITEPNPNAFMRAIVDYGNWPAEVIDESIRHLCPERQMIVLLDAFTLAINSGGIEQALDPGVGCCFEEIRQFCRTIGALRTVEYLEKIAACFPDGKIPKDEGKRFQVLQQIKSQLKLRGFHQLDLEHRDSILETLSALQRFIVDHEDRFERALSRKG